MSLEALIFDVDGTLADTERDGHRVAFNRAFADAGLDWDWSEEVYGELLSVTGGKERIKHFVENHLRDFKTPDDFDEQVKALHASKTNYYTQLMAQAEIPLRAGVRRLLNEARKAKLRLAIATTTTPANVTALLASTGITDLESWFEVIGAGDVVPSKKPAPDIYNYVMEKMNLKPEQCVAFEDSRNGILSSLAAGLRTVVTVNGYTSEDNFDGALIVMDGLGEPDSPFEVLSETPAYGINFFNLSLLDSLTSSAD